MSKVLLQPAGSLEADEHYRDTVDNPVDLSKISKFLQTEIVNELKGLYSGSAMPVWGVTSGKDEGNKSKWEKVETGDVVLFSADSRIFSSATVVLKTHNKELAKELWGVDANGNTWEYIYFLDELTPQYIPLSKFNQVADYKDNYIIRGFNVLGEDISERLITYFKLRSGVYYPAVTVDEYRKVIDANQVLDKKGQITQRTEQSFLRNFLFKKKFSEKCSICQKDYPIQFLVASHIKQRSECSDEEKRDFENIVVPMCKFGCDELFERGYIFVNDDGRIDRNPRKNLTKAVEAYISQFEKTECCGWKKETARYFKWHKEKNLKLK